MPAGHAAPTGAALDSLVEQVLARAALRSPGMAAAENDGSAPGAGGLPALDVRLPPAALAAQAAHEAAINPPQASPAGSDEQDASPGPETSQRGVHFGVPVLAASLIDQEAAWLPSDPDRREAFLQVFRFWHARVQPQYAHQATPAFLYLVTALPVLIKARDELKAERLWEPKSESSHARRDAHPAWKKYCEFLPRAQQATVEIKAYRTVSLLSGLDDLFARVTTAEKMYRQA